MKGSRLLIRFATALLFLGAVTAILLLAGERARADAVETGTTQDVGSVEVPPEIGQGLVPGVELRSVRLIPGQPEPAAGPEALEPAAGGEGESDSPAPRQGEAPEMTFHYSRAEEGLAGGEETIEPSTPPGVSKTSSPGQASSVVDPRIAVRVGFESPGDAGKINPRFEVVDPSGNKVAFVKGYDPRHGTYELRFDYPVNPENPRVTVRITAPGYEPCSREVILFRNPMDPHDPDYYGLLEVTLTATPAYRLGYQVAARADEVLGFAGAEKILCITNAGSARFQGKSSEDAIEGILNYSGGRITMGSGGLLMLRGTYHEPLDFAFVVQRGADLLLAFFRHEGVEPLYVGTVSRHRLTEAAWRDMTEKMGRARAFAVASLANAWAEGVPADLLQAAAFHGHLCLGTVSGYAMVEVLIRQFPPGFGGSGIEDTSYRVLGVPGGSDDDVFQWLLDATPGKRAYVGRKTVEEPNIVGFIRWDARNRRGTLVVMRFDQEGLMARFLRETGISVLEDTPSELHFNAWLLSKLLSSPDELVEIVIALDELDEEECNRLTGGMGSATVQTAHGLDMAYINELATRKPPALRADASFPVSPLTNEDIREIGKRAALMAVDLFRQELGIKLERDDPCLLALTSAGYARLFGLPTTYAWDGIFEVLGSRLTRRTLLPVHSSLLGTLWFAFSLLSDGRAYSVYLRYDPVTLDLVPGRTQDGRAVHDIGPETLNDNAKLNLVRPVFGAHFSSVQTIANAMRHDPPFEMVMVYLFHNHVCPGVSPAWLIADHVYREFPLGEDERYIYLTTTNFCKDDGLIYLLGLSSGGGTYYNLRLLSGDDTSSQLVPGGSMDGILVKWNERLQVGLAIIITFAWPQWDTSGLTTDAARREAQIGAFIRYYKGVMDPRMTVAPVVATETAKWITREELEAIVSWSPDDPRGNVLRFIMGLPNRELSDLIPPIPEEGNDESPGVTPEQEGGVEDSDTDTGQPTEPVDAPEVSVTPGTPETGGSEGAPTPGTGSSPGENAFRPGPSPVRRALRPRPMATILPLPSAETRVEEKGERAEEAGEASGPTPSDEDARARAYEVEEVTEGTGSGALALALAGLAALLVLGTGGFLLARRRRVP